MARLRGIVFLVCYYLLLVVFLIVLAPTLVMPDRAIVAVYRFYCHALAGAMRLILGVDYEVRGRENVPRGAVLIAAKHQSAWETYLFCLIFGNPAFVLKEELMRIPLFGDYLRKLGMVPIVRGSGPEALRRMKEAAARMIEAGRPIVVFPEGTRQVPGAAPAYKSGVAHLYRDFGLPAVPVALNSGVFWPKAGLPRGPGRIIVEIGEPIAAGLAPGVFRGVLREALEASCDRLLVLSDDNRWGRIGPVGKARIAALKGGDR